VAASAAGENRDAIGESAHVTGETRDAIGKSAHVTSKTREAVGKSVDSNAQETISKPPTRHQV